MEPDGIPSMKINGVGYILGLPPSQDSSHHQDDITFLVGDPYKPSFATVTGRGVDPSYINWMMGTPNLYEWEMVGNHQISIH